MCSVPNCEEPGNFSPLPSSPVKLCERHKEGFAWTMQRLRDELGTLGLEADPKAAATVALRDILFGAPPRLV